MSNLQNTLPTESAPAGGRALRCASSGPTSRNRGAVGAGIVVIVLILALLRRCSRRTARSSNTATS